mmetsp:Transcript_29174/g.71160  ORF Transcript_29174/g.71160 Transcript_29174/m.71160 type:complete len:99 (+) Transcript_29174:81-377(+)
MMVNDHIGSYCKLACTDSFESKLSSASRGQGMKPLYEPSGTSKYVHSVLQRRLIHNHPQQHWRDKYQLPVCCTVLVVMPAIAATSAAAASAAGSLKSK